MIEQTIFQIVVNGGAFALAVWLVFDTRREAQRREQYLLGLIDTQSKRLENICQTLEKIDQRLAEWEKSA